MCQAAGLSEEELKIISSSLEEYKQLKKNSTRLKLVNKSDRGLLMKRRKPDKIFIPGNIHIEDYLMRLPQGGYLGYTQLIFITMLKLQNSLVGPLGEIALLRLLAELDDMPPDRIHQNLGWLVENCYLKPGKESFTFTLIDTFCCYRWVGDFPIPKTAGAKSL